MANTNPHSKIKNYVGYKNLPPLVGLTSPEQAASHGLSVGESVARFKSQHWLLRRLHEILCFRLTSMPIFELKTAFSLHQHICAEWVSQIQTRIREMREPPYGLDECPDVALDHFCNEVKYVPHVEGLILGLYEKAFPALERMISNHLAETNALFDHPTHRICKLMLVEIREINEYGRKAVECLIEEGTRKEQQPWLALLDQLESLFAVGTATTPEAELPAGMHGAKPFAYDPIPQRDERFIDPYNQGVNAEAYLFDSEKSPLSKTLMLYFKRMREIDVPEFMSSIIEETKGKPWAYYRDLSRQLWDEARHSLMGEVGLVATGIDWTTIPMTFNTSIGLNTRATPQERHAVLFTVEQGLMGNKNGKKAEWELAVSSACPLCALIQDYDWADEIVHARIGRDWLTPEFGSQAKVLEVGDQAWNRILVDWHKLKEEGLTEHRNWWPEAYRKACEHWGVDPVEAELNYAITYAGKRSDFKEVVVA